MAKPVPYVNGLLLQHMQSGAHSHAFSGLVSVKVAAADFADTGMHAQLDAATPSLVSPQTNGAPEKSLGVVIGTLVGGSLDTNHAPLAGELAVIAVGMCEVYVLLQAALTAGTEITLGATDGLVDAWTSPEPLVGTLLEDGAAGDKVLALVRPITFGA